MEKGTKRRVKKLGTAFFVLYVLVLVYLLCFFIILSGFFISLTIEVIQLLTKVGCFDVDDMILNTLGAALGYGIYAVCDRIRRKINGKKI